MKRIAVLIVALGVVLFMGSVAPVKAVEVYDNGNQLYAALQNDMGGTLYAEGYIAGIADSCAVNIAKGRKEEFEVPDDVKSKQLVDIVFIYLKNNPRNRHLAAPILIEKALKEAFPMKITK